MPWPVASEKNKLSWLSLAGLTAGTWLMCLVGASANALDGQVGVSVCGADAPSAQIDITQPLSDSVVGQSPVTFRGTVANASQIEIDINGSYSETFALAANATSFQTDISLPVGTSTVKMTANAICGGQDESDSVVVTFQPATEPTNGGTTPTVVDGAVTLDGTPVVTEEIEKDDIAEIIESLPIVGPVASAVSDFASMIGLEATVASNNTPVVAGTARVALTVVALSSIVMAGSAAPLAAQAVPGLSELFNVQSHRSMLYLGWVIRGVALVALAIAYFI